MNGNASVPVSARPGVLSLVLLGILLVLMGIPFAGMAVMTALLLPYDGKGGGLLLSLVVLAGVFFVTDFVGASIAAAGAGVMTLSIRSGMDLTSAVGSAAAGAALISIAGLIFLPALSLLSPESVEALMQVYSAAGLSVVEVGQVFDVFLYIIPALLALWAVGGAVVAGATVKNIATRRGTPVLSTGGGLRLGLLPAWILIACLGVNLLGSSAGPMVRQGAVNVLVFMALPYLMVGLAVVRAALRTIPSLTLLAALFAILLPPAAMGLLILLGITDTLLDFRLRLAKLKERNMTT